MERIAIATCGGHISSFNAAIGGIADIIDRKIEILGFIDGFKGVNEGNHVILRSKDKYPYLEPEKGGSMIGCSREKADERAKNTIERLGIDALIVMGGDDHLGEAKRLYKEFGLPVIGWPKTMDNDLSGTYFCFGYPTAVERAAAIVREAYANAQTNSRIHLITMFGRDTDWVVAGAGAWGVADVVVPGEQELDISKIFGRTQEAADRNAKDYKRRFAVVAVAEGAKIRGIEDHLRSDEIDAHGNPKIEPMKLALVLKDKFKELGEKCISIDSITYAMRNGPPVRLDMDFAYHSAYAISRLLSKGDFGKSVVIERDNFPKHHYMEERPLEEVAKKRYLRPEGFIDYDTLTVRQSFIDYYTPLFGKPMRKEEIVYRERC